MDKSGITVLGIIGIFILAVSISGCTNTNNATQTYNLNNSFNKSGISFKYPSDFKATNPKFVVNADIPIQHLVTLASPDSKTKIGVNKMPLENYTNATIRGIVDKTKFNSISSGFKVLSDTTITVPGSSESIQLIYTQTNPKTKELQKGYFLFMGNQGKAEYGIQVFGNNNDFTNTKALYKKLLPTIQIQ